MIAVGLFGICAVLISFGKSSSTQKEKIKFFNRLPNHLILHIFSFLEIRDIFACDRSAKQFAAKKVVSHSSKYPNRVAMCYLPTLLKYFPQVTGLRIEQRAEDKQLGHWVKGGYCLAELTPGLKVMHKFESLAELDIQDLPCDALCKVLKTAKTVKSLQAVNLRHCPINPTVIYCFPQVSTVRFFNCLFFDHWPIGVDLGDGFEVHSLEEPQHTALNLSQLPNSVSALYCKARPEQALHNFWSIKDLPLTALTLENIKPEFNANELLLPTSLKIVHIIGNPSGWDSKEVATHLETCRPYLRIYFRASEQEDDLAKQLEDLKLSGNSLA